MKSSKSAKSSNYYDDDKVTTRTTKLKISNRCLLFLNKAETLQNTIFIKVVKRPPGRFEAIPDDLTSIEILEQAKMAAKGAANRLKIYKPKSKMGFLRQKPDGSTSLKFLTGNSGITPGAENNERPVTLGTLIGKVKQGKPNFSKPLSRSIGTYIQMKPRTIF